MRKLAVALSQRRCRQDYHRRQSGRGPGAGTGLRVLLIDVDTQGQAAKALGLAPPTGLAELATGEVDAGQAVATSPRQP